MPPRRYALFFVAALALMLLVALASCQLERAADAIPDTGQPRAQATTQTATQTSATPEQTLAADPGAFVDAAGLDIAERRVIQVYQEVAPSVVNVTTRVLELSFFLEPVAQEGSGSGFVIDEAGHILTNYHVVEDAQQIEVTFGDGTVLPARLVGADPHNDIALLRVDAPPELLVPVEFGNSDELRVGQRAIAIGNPFGQFERTLTTGVVSALDRSLQSPDGNTISGIIQTDADINRGNSGGPLLDSSGRVIGMNTAIFSPTGTNAGLGFAVPVATIKRVLPDLLELGYYRHPWLGIRSAYQLTPGLANRLNLPLGQGLLLVQLHPQSPLAEVGVRGARREVIFGNVRAFLGGDILRAVDGHAVTSMEDLRTYLETNHQVGDEVSLTLIRGRRELTVEVELAEEPRG